MIKRCIQLLVLTVFVLHVSTYSNFQDLIPNGNNVAHPCKANFIWHGVGHENAFGAGVRNVFGKDFYYAGKTWSTELCRKDSDGDGSTNGEELGDPDCIWEVGKIPSRVTKITHPGICTLQDGSVCEKEKEWVDCNVEDGLKNCPALDEPETRNMTVRFPETVVPPKETSYMCMTFNLPADQDYHLVAHEPVIDNANIMHHIILYGCDPADPVEESELNKVTPCNMAKQCQTIIGLWAVGFPGYCLDGPTGFLFGKRAGAYKQAALEFHWNNPELKNTYTDSSGMTLFFTPKLRQYDAGILMTGQNYLEIPPGLSKYSVEGYCPSDCTKVLMKDSINVFWASNHMHYLGHEMKIEVERNGQFFTRLTHDEIYNYDNPIEHKYTTAVEIKPGDSITTTCTFKSTSRPKTTFYGQATSDEMCFGFLAYYPAGNLYSPVCTSWKGISLCDLYVKNQYEGCRFRQFMNSTHPETAAIVQRVKENCRPYGNCLKECKPVLKDLFANNPCMSGDVYDFIRNRVFDYMYENEPIENEPMIEFLASVDSCKVELASDQFSGNGNNDDTNAASYLISSVFTTMLVISFVLL